MRVFMQKLRRKVAIGLVGGSDLAKIEEQMLGTGELAPRRDRFSFSPSAIAPPCSADGLRLLLCGQRADGLPQGPGAGLAGRRGLVNA